MTEPSAKTQPSSLFTATLAETEAKLATAAPAKKASSMAYTEADNPSTGLIAPPMRAATEQRIQLFRLAHRR